MRNARDQSEAIAGQRRVIYEQISREQADCTPQAIHKAHLSMHPGLGRRQRNQYAEAVSVKSACFHASVNRFPASAASAVLPWASSAALRPYSAQPFSAL